MIHQESARAEWRRDLEGLIAESERIVTGLSDRQLRWQPPEGGWSAGQVLDHLARTNEQYLAVIDSALASPRALDSSRAEWRPSLAGWALGRSLLSSRKARAPAAFVPAPVASEDPLHRFHESVRALVAALARADRADLRKTRIPSPAARILRLNLGDGFRLQILHAHRHFAQIERVKARPQFPR